MSCKLSCKLQSATMPNLRLWHSTKCGTHAASLFAPAWPMPCCAAQQMQCLVQPDHIKIENVVIGPKQTASNPAPGSTATASGGTLN